MTDVVIHRPTGGYYSIPHIKSKIKRRENKQTTASVITARNHIDDLEEGQYEVEIVDNGTEFRGPLKDKKYTGTKARLEVASFLQYAKEAKPTGAKVPYANESDKKIVKDAIDGIPDLEPGTIHSVQPAVTVLFHHATRALQIQMMRKQSKAHVRYNSDATVDYLRPGSAGSDRTGTVLSPANQNLETATPKTQGGERTKTHLRMIGSGSTSIDVVSDAYTEGDRERWGRAQFKEVSNERTLRRFGKLLLEDLSESWLEVKAKLTDVSDVVLHDKFTVNYPEKGIENRELRVAEVTEIRDKSGLHYEAQLSNRTFARNHDVAKQQRRTSEEMRTTQTSASPNVPQLNFGGTILLPAGKFIDQMLIVPPKSSLYVWAVQQEPGSVNVSFKIVMSPTDTRGEGELIYEQPYSSYERDSPLVQYKTGPQREFAFRLDNTSDEDTPTGAAVAYSIERIPNAEASS